MDEYTRLLEESRFPSEYYIHAINLRPQFSNHVDYEILIQRVFSEIKHEFNYR